MDIVATIENDRITRIVINGYEILCNANLKDWDEIKSLLVKLTSMNVFTKRLPRPDPKKFIEKLVPNEKKLIISLSTDQFIPIKVLQNELGMKGRQIAGILANITKKARETDLAPDNESIYESKWEKGQFFYKLKKNQYIIEMLNMLKSGEKHD
jgi:hypothetical protein